MSEYDKQKLKKSAFCITGDFLEIRNITGAFSAVWNPYENAFEMQVDEKGFDVLCKDFNLIPCVEIQEQYEFPVKKYVYVKGVKFFMLAKMEELKEAS